MCPPVLGALREMCLHFTYLYISLWTWHILADLRLYYVSFSFLTSVRSVIVGTGKADVTEQVHSGLGDVNRFDCV